MSRKSSVLDSLRAVAVLLVLADHLLETLRVTGWLERVAWMSGRLGVVMFFVHTALVLMLSMDRHSLRGAALFRDFYIRRAFRLYPLALATIVLVITAHVPNVPWGDVRAPLTTYNIASNALLLENLIGGTLMLRPMWSLSAEVLMYLVLPALFIIVLNRPRFSTVALFWCCAVVAGIVVPMQTNRLSVAYYSPCFMSGVVAYWVTRRTRPHWSFRAWSFTLSALVLVYALIGFATETVHVAAAAWGACLVLGCLLPRFAETQSALVRRVSHTIATYSYSIYLGHCVALWIGFSIGTSVIAQLAISLVCLVAFCIIGYHGIEAPFIRLGQRIAQRQEVPSTTPINVPLAT